MKKVYTDSWFLWCSWAILCFWVSWRKLKKNTDSNTLVRSRFLAVSMSLSMSRRLSTRRFIAVTVTETDTTTITTSTTATTIICDVSEKSNSICWFGLGFGLTCNWDWLDWFGLVWRLFWDCCSLLNFRFLVSDDDEKERNRAMWMILLSFTNVIVRNKEFQFVIAIIEFIFFMRRKGMWIFFFLFCLINLFFNAFWHGPCYFCCSFA